MTPSYDSVTRKAGQTMSSLCLQKNSSFGLLAILLLSFNFLQAQVVISEVFDDGSFELRNTGDAEVDISGYWICDFPRYRALTAITKECGDFLLVANGEAVFSDTSLFQIDDSELGLYTAEDFSNADAMISYLEWGSTGHTRSGLAIGKSIWDGNAAPAFTSGQSLEINGDGTTAASWSVNDNPQACASSTPPTATSSARYRVTFDATWSAATHPTDFPSNPHFSGLIGLTHTADVALFSEGTVASSGIVSMAETGAKGTLTSEMQAIIAAGQGQTIVSGGGVDPSPGSVSVEFDISNAYPLVSITSMIAPSPDWFIGIKDVDLFANGDWVSSATVAVGSYDAGSDSGQTFTSANQSTNPAGTVSSITDGPLATSGTVPSMGTMTFTRIDAGACDAEGGTLAGGPFTYCVDGAADNIPTGSITLNGNTGSNNQWVVTDLDGNILGLPPMPSAVDFDELGAGVCLIWNIAYEDDLTGLMMGNNVSVLEGCFSLSNSVTVTRNQPAGGTLAGGPFTYCVDGIADNIPANGITLSGNTGGNSQWVITDEQGKILGLPPSFTGPDFDAAGIGVCQVWHLSYEDGLAGLAMDNNVSELVGCFNFSNPIAVTRQDCGDMCNAAGGTITGGPFTFDSVGDGVADMIPAGSITLTNNQGANTAWVITDSDGNILGLPSMPGVVNFDNPGAGTCLIWHLAYDGDITGLERGLNANDLQGCFSLSNSIEVIRRNADGCNANGGEIFGGPFTFDNVGDGLADMIPAGSITLTNNQGANTAWVITDSDGNILGLPSMPGVVNFDTPGAGTCLIWHLAYDGEITGLERGLNANSLQGCFSLSNSIEVIRRNADGCDVNGGEIFGGPFAFDSVGDDVADMIPAGSITLTNSTGPNSQWVVTDDQGSILGLPPMPSAVDFDGAGSGTCLIWHLSFEDGLQGAAVGLNANDLQGCFSLSNPIEVVRTSSNSCDVTGGTLVGGPFTYCVDGVADNIPANGITLSGNDGGNSQWVVTDEQGNILGLPLSFTGPDFDAAGIGVCQVWHLSYEDGLTGLAMGSNVSQLEGCFNFSNPVSVTREECTDNMCMAPSDIKIDILGARKVVVDWNDVDDAARYIVEIRFAGRDRVVGRGRVRRSKVFIFAPSNRDYEIQIKTVCQDGGESVFTEWFSFSTPAVGGFASATGRNSDNFSADIGIKSTTNKALTAYPNPVKDYLTINYSITAETGQLEIFHVSGQKVLETTLSNGETNHQVDLSNLTEGIYLMKITESGNASITKRIVKTSQR